MHFSCFTSNPGTHYLLHIIAETGSLLSHSFFFPLPSQFSSLCEVPLWAQLWSGLSAAKPLTVNAGVQACQSGTTRWPPTFSVLFSVSFPYLPMCRPSTSFWIPGSYYVLSHLSFFQFILFPLPEILLLIFFLLKFHFLHEVFLDSHSQNFFLISVLPLSMYLPCFKALTTFSSIALHVQVYLYCCVVQSQKMSFLLCTFPFSLGKSGPLSTCTYITDTQEQGFWMNGTLSQDQANGS